MPNPNGSRPKNNANNGAGRRPGGNRTDRGTAGSKYNSRADGSPKSRQRPEDYNTSGQRNKYNRYNNGQRNYNGQRNAPETDDAFFVCGVHPVEETLAVLPEEILKKATLWVADTRSTTDLGTILETAKQYNLAPSLCPMQELDRRTGETRHQGVLLDVPTFPYADLDDTLAAVDSPAPLLLALDQIQDPHNLGAIIRSAAAFGVHAVIIPKDRAAQITPTVLKTSAGQAWRVPVCRVTNLAQTLRKLKDDGFTVFGADIEGEPLPSIDFNLPCVIVMGSEGDGMRRLTRTFCDKFARIEHDPGVESLNVSVAAAIFLYQASITRK